MKMNLKVQVALHLICTRITLCYVIQVLNSALISQYMTHTQHIHAALINSLKQLLRGGGGRGVFFRGVGGRALELW